jgi:hypothetical protein
MGVGDIKGNRMPSAEALRRLRASLRAQPEVVDMGLGGHERWINGSEVVVDRDALAAALDHFGAIAYGRRG